MNTLLLALILQAKPAPAPEAEKAAATAQTAHETRQDLKAARADLAIIRYMDKQEPKKVKAEKMHIAREYKLAAIVRAVRGAKAR